MTNLNLFSEGGPFPALSWAHMVVAGSGAVCFISVAAGKN